MSIKISGLKGVDLNRHNGNVDFTKLTKQDVHYVGIRCTVGKYYTDPRFIENVLKSEDHGLPWIPYHVVRGTHDKEEQVDRFFNSLIGYDPQMGIALDIELKEYRLYTNTDYMINCCENEGYKFVTLYAPKWIEGYNPPGKMPDRWKRYRYWPSHYANVEQPNLASPWKTWDIWQYSADRNNLGHLYGCDSDDIDLNVFNGGKEAFNLCFGLEEIPPDDTVNDVFFPDWLTMGDIYEMYNESGNPADTAKG